MAAIPAKIALAVNNNCGFASLSCVKTLKALHHYIEAIDRALSHRLRYALTASPKPVFDHQHENKICSRWLPRSAFIRIRLSGSGGGHED